MCFTVGWLLLGSGELNKGQDYGNVYLQLVCKTHLTSWQEKRVINSNKPYIGDHPDHRMIPISSMPKPGLTSSNMKLIAHCKHVNVLHTVTVQRAHQRPAFIEHNH